MTRVAVAAGAAWVRVAVGEPRPRLVAELPVPGADLRSVLAGLFPEPVTELRVVHPAGGPPVVPAGVAETVLGVPSAVAVAAGIGDGTSSIPDAVPDPVPDAVAVVDVGHAGAEVALVRGGGVVAVRRIPVGGAVLDAVTGRLLAEIAGRGAGAEPQAPHRRGRTAPAEQDARRIREALSLLPAVRTGGPGSAVLQAEHLDEALSVPLAALVDAVRAVVPATDRGRAPPVLLAGGVARSPLVAGLLDAAGIAEARVVPRPDAAAVLGAFRVPTGAPSPIPAFPPGGPGPRVRRPADGWPAATGPVAAGRTSGSAVPAVWLPPVAPVRHRRSRVVGGAVAATATVAGLLVAGAALPPPRPAPTEPAGELVQYGYAVRLPAGWAHTGGLPERRRSLLTPRATPDGSDLISVERTPLGYDADAEPRRARAELRAAFTAAVAEGAPLTGFDDGARFAGRPVVAYREEGGAEAGDVDWYVVLDGDAQLSVGCRHTAAGASLVDAACETVVGSLHRTS